MSLIKFSASLVLACCVMTVGAAAPPQDYVATAKRYLLETAGSGWSFSPSIHTGSLGRSGTYSFTASLERGVRYRIAGQCDNDCDDLDIHVYRDGALVVEDVEVDDYPLVFVTPTTSGSYNIRAAMAGCKVAPCGFAVGVMNR